MSSTPLKALIIEDSRSDALLMVRKMRRGGFAVDYLRVETAVDLESALENKAWDLILSDYSMPRFSAPEALHIVRQKKSLDIPFIVVSGTIGEEAAVAVMKAGANDFFAKDKLTRLVSAIERELHEAEGRHKRRLAEAQLRKTEERFTKAFQASPVAIAISRLSDGVTLAVNPRFVEIFGYEQGEIVGKNGSELDLWADPEQRQALTERLRSSETVQNVEIEFRSTAGERIYGLLSAEVIELDDEPCVLSFVQDVTELRQRQEEIVETKNLLEKTFAGLGEAVFVIDSRDRSILMCNNAVENVFGYRPEELIGQSTRLLHVDQEMYEQFGEVGEPVLKTDNVFQVEYLMRRKNGNIIYTENTVTTLDEEKGFLAGVVSVVRDITEQKKAEEQIKRAHERISLLRDIAVAANEATDINSVLQFTLDAVCAYTDWEIGHVYLIHNNQDAALHSTPIWHLVDDACFHKFRRYTEANYAVAHTGMVQKVLETKQTQLINDVGNSSDFVRTKVARQCGLHGGYGIPIFANNQVMGVLEFFSRQKPDEFAQDVIEISVHIGSQVGRAIERQWAVRQLQHYTERLELLYDVDQAILNTEHPPVTAQKALQQLKRIIPFYGASVITFDLENNQATYIAIETEGDPVYEVGQTVPLKKWPAVSLLRDKRPYIVHDTQEISEPIKGEKQLIAGGIRSFISTPLIFGGRLLGTLNLRSDKPNVFSQATIDITMEVADQLAIAINNAELYQQIQQHALELEQRVAERTAELQHQNKRIETILRSSNDAILLLAQDGRILQANQAFCAIFGWDSQEVVGNYFSRAARVAESDRFQQALQRLSAQQTYQRIELTVHNLNGDPIEVDAILSPVKNNNEKESLEIVCSLRDITVRKQAEAELRRALEKEKELNELKSSFTSMISHEFRTPLSVIKVSADILAKFFDRMDEERRNRRLDAINQQVKRLARLMDDVLLLSRGDQAGLVFEPAPVDLVALCHAVIEEVKTAYDKEKSVDFQFDKACRGRHMDEHLFMHIFQNLLSNAFKYSPPPSPVAVRLTCTEETTTLIVEDQGIGIPEAYQKNLFKSFHRAQNVGAVEGTGLGLAIVKRAVDEHGGTIDVNSIEGQGTSFTVTLPNL